MLKSFLCIISPWPGDNLRHSVERGPRCARGHGIFSHTPHQGFFVKCMLGSSASCVSSSTQLCWKVSGSCLERSPCAQIGRLVKLPVEVFPPIDLFASSNTKNSIIRKMYPPRPAAPLPRLKIYIETRTSYLQPGSGSKYSVRLCKCRTLCVNMHAWSIMQIQRESLYCKFSPRDV